MVKKFYKFLIAVLVVFNFILAEAKDKKNLEDLTIIVSSYDKFSNIWPIFFDKLFKCWPSLNSYNKNIPIILVSNTKIFNDPRVITVTSPSEYGWSGNMNEALSQIKTKYVLYLQDDYFVRDKILEKEIAAVVDAMNENNLDYVEIHPRCKFGKEKIKNAEFLTYKDRNKPCLTTLQAAIWNTKTFQEFTAQKTPSIWAFEDLSIKPHHKFAYFNKKVKPVDYLNFMYRGYVNFYPYCQVVYEGYDLSFLKNNKIHPKYRFIQQAEWYRRHMPKFSHLVFKVIGFLKIASHNIKYSIISFFENLNN